MTYARAYDLCYPILTLWLRLWSLTTIWNITSLNTRPVYGTFMWLKIINRIAYVQITIFIKTILESPYKVLLGPFILVAPTWSSFFFNGPWVLSNFWHLDCYNFGDILRKKCKIILFRSLNINLQKHTKIHTHWATHYGETAI